MTEHTANQVVDSRTRMLPPLLVFGVACFLFAGAIKFHLKGGDIWFARAMGAPVTCLFLAFVASFAGRWFFGSRPAAVGAKVLAALVVMLPLMGLLGVVQGATRGPAADANGATLLGGTFGAMLAGPRAFGSLGTTVAGIIFAILALFGAYLARRITVPTETAKPEDPYTALKAMTAKRASAAEDRVANIASIDDDDDDSAIGAVAPARGDLFPADAELEPEPVAIATAEDDEPEETATQPWNADEPEVEEVVREPLRAPLLAGLVEDGGEEDEKADEAPTAARFFASALVHPPVRAMARQDEDEIATLSLDDEDEDEDIGAMPRAPSLEPDEDAVAEVEEEVDEEVEVEARAALAVSEPEIESMAAGESPELAAEWLAAPHVFHTPRAIETEIAANEALYDILDVEARPEPEPVVERPRFRIKADYVRHEQEPDVLTEEPAASVEAPAPVEEEDPVVWTAAPERESRSGRLRAFNTEEEKKKEDEFGFGIEIENEVAAEPVAEIASSEEPEPEVASKRNRSRRRRALTTEDEDRNEEERGIETENEIAAVPEEAPTPEPAPIVEAQLELPDMPAAPAAAAAETAEETKPKRRMRSAKKDWASWDEAPKERPRLRLVKAEPEDEQLEVPGMGGDDSYDRAVAVVVKEDRCSVSLLQRNLGVTFGEATALIDRMYQQGVVGPYQPTGRRDVLLGKKGAAAAEES
jgi:hypothetical protein